MFIRPTGIYHLYSQMLACVDNIIQKQSWKDKNQILLNSRMMDSDPWHDGVGKVYDTMGKRIIFEKDFTVWNDIPEFLKSNLIDLSLKENIKFGRVRLMKLPPRAGLSVHRDLETRYHYVLKTNNKSYFCQSQFNDTTAPSAMCWHIPSDGQWYHVDTRLNHFVYNGGDTDRIHLVACALSM